MPIYATRQHDWIACFVADPREIERSGFLAGAYYVGFPVPVLGFFSVFFPLLIVSDHFQYPGRAWDRCFGGSPFTEGCSHLAVSEAPLGVGDGNGGQGAWLTTLSRFYTYMKYVSASE